MCQRHGANTQLVEGPEGGQAAVHGVTPLHTDQTADAAPPTGEQQLCTHSTNTLLLHHSMCSSLYSTGEPSLPNTSVLLQAASRSFGSQLVFPNQKFCSCGIFGSAVGSWKEGGAPLQR